MSRPTTLEAQILEPIESLLKKFAIQSKNVSFEFRLQLLEATSSRLGGFPLKKYHTTFGITPLTKYAWMDDAGKYLAEALGHIQIHPSLALSALAREPLPLSSQRVVGAYYTDFRLAKYIAEISKDSLIEGARVLDPASGTGILLVAASIFICGSDRRRFPDWLANSVFAADQSEIALRGARLALSSLVGDLSVISEMYKNWRIHDSLEVSDEVWTELAPKGFDLVVGNPPWEKVKLTRHEFLKASGVNRHYGDTYKILDGDSYNQKRKDVAKYAQRLVDRFSLLKSGEPDLYMAFIQLSSQIVRSNGCVSILVPAGLVRSQGTKALREFLLENTSKLSTTIIENRSRFFPIDTRFKFLVLNYILPKEDKKPKRNPLNIYHATGTHSGITQTGAVRIGRRSLKKIRPDMTVPEVRNYCEWKTFLAMARHGVNWEDRSSVWFPEIVREVDMTRQYALFHQKPSKYSLPVIEGRMLQGHRFGAKEYVSGTGRRATWKPVPLGHLKVKPQFWIENTALGAKISKRIQQPRIGFCDIAGQTNERSMMAAMVPPSVVCGNKVPTITFPNDPSEERMLLWIGIVNSFPFDWMLRRVLTTSVNYFLLRSVPLPELEPSSLPGKRIVKAVRLLNLMNSGNEKFDGWRSAELRASIDLSVLTAYGLKYDELKMMLSDFPLLDRGQPALSGERVSSITQDFLMFEAARRYRRSTTYYAARINAACKLGACPYITAEMVIEELDKRKSTLDE